MTREEALNATVAGMIVNRDYVRDTINTIFDDLETRTCENCKYYQMYMPHNNPHDQFNIMDCIANDNGSNIVSYPPPTFGCNKFEREQD